MNEFSTDMADAPQDETLVLLLPDPDDPDFPYLIVTGRWDAEKGGWEGYWRDFEDTETFEPIAWAFPPEITEEVAAAVDAQLASSNAA